MLPWRAMRRHAMQPLTAVGKRSKRCKAPLSAATRSISTAEYEQMHAESLADPEKFWGQQSKAIKWEKPFETVLDSSQAPFYKWFSGGKVNMCYNAVDRHVDEGRGDQVALVYDSPVTNTKQKFTYSDLQDNVARLASVLAQQGVGKGDRVLIYLPMIPEAVFSMLACARIGAVHSVVFGGFAAPELAVRIDDAEPKVILSSSCGIESTRVIHYKPLLDEALQVAAHKPGRCLIHQRPEAPADLVPGRDLDWATEVQDAPYHPCVSVESTDPLYILYTSGTTGVPKGVLRDTGGHAVALTWAMKNLMECEQGDTFFAASDVGWVVGHSYIVYAPLLSGCTSVLYEGKPVGTPDAGAFWRICEEYGVKALFAAPTAMRAIRKEDPNGEKVGDYDLSKLSVLFVAGERSDPATCEFYQNLLQCRVIDNWWQTETGWPVCGLQLDHIGMRGGSTGLPLPGYDVQVLCDQEERDSKDPPFAVTPVPSGTPGNLAIKLPLPPGTFPTLYNDPERFVSSYMSAYPGYYQTGDAGVVDEDGYVTVLERTDDVINVAAHRLSCGSVEEVCCCGTPVDVCFVLCSLSLLNNAIHQAIKGHSKVNDCAVVGVADGLKGQVPVAFVIVNDGISEAEYPSIIAEIKENVRSQVGCAVLNLLCVHAGQRAMQRATVFFFVFFLL